MTETAEERPKSPLAQRLGTSMVAMRPDLDFSRHVFGQESYYLVRDPVTFNTHRFSERDYRVLVRLDRRLTLGSIFSSMVEEGAFSLAAEDRFYEFVVSLHRIGFLDLPIPDEKRLYDRHLARKKAQNVQRLMSAFFLQIPLWNPESFLQRTRRVARFFYSVPVFVIWLLLQGLALTLAIENFDELVAPIGQVLVMSNVPILWATLVGLKVIHEMGHAWACKRFGGQVPEMGIYLIALTPCAYVDATGSWTFPKKIQRVIVCMGGMYFELFAAALAMIVWAMAESEIVRSAAYNIVFLASFATVAFNANPMMKSDGYFALSDILEVPNLRSRATGYAGSFFKHLSLGIPMRKDRSPWWMKLLFIAYGVFLPIYRFGVVTGLALTVAMKLFVVGIALAGSYCAMELFKISTKLFKLFFVAEETRQVRVRAASLGIVVFVAIPAILAGLPLPDRVVLPAAVRAENEDVIRAAASGFLQEIPPDSGSLVAEGQLIFRLSNPGLEEKMIMARAAVEEAELKLRAVSVREPSLIQREESLLKARRQQLSAIEDLQSRLIYEAQEAGVLIDEGEVLGQGTWIHDGAALGRIVSGRLEAVMLLTEEEYETLRPQVGDSLRFRSLADADHDLRGVISHVAKTGSRSVSLPGLTQEGGGQIVVDPMHRQALRSYFEVVCKLDHDASRLPLGATGRVLLHGRPETLGMRGLRSLLNVVNRVRHGSL